MVFRLLSEPRAISDPLVGVVYSPVCRVPDNMEILILLISNIPSVGRGSLFP